MSRERDADEVWVPVTLHLPLGFAKGLSPASCAPIDLFVGPFTLVMLSQTANTILTPVLPFLVTDMGHTAVLYGTLQSMLWGAQTLFGPMHGMLSDRLGRRPVIVVTLLISAISNGMLASAKTIPMLVASRLVGGLGFQITLLKAYFADATPKTKRTNSFGMIGVVQGFSLFAGPAIGGIISRAFGLRMAAWFSAFLFFTGFLIALVWRPQPKVAVEPHDHLEERPPSPHDALVEDGSKTTKTEGGVQYVKVDLTSDPAHPHGDHSRRKVRRVEYTLDEAFCGACTYLWSRMPVRVVKTMRFLGWLAGYDVYPLLCLNFVFRFAFAVYKSVFAFYCMKALGFGTAEVDAALSTMGTTFYIIDTLS